MRLGATGMLRGGACASALVALLLAGCGGGGQEPVGLAATQTAGGDADSEPTEQPTPESDSTDGTPGADSTGDPETDPTDGSSPADDTPETAGGQVHEFSDIGVTVVEPDEVPGDVAVALERYVTFIYEWRWSLQEVEISEEIERLAAPNKVRSLEGSIDYQTENGIHYGGELTITLDYEDSNEHMVAFSGCMDASDYAWIDDEGEHPIRGENGNETAVVNTTVMNTGGLWLVDEVIEENESC